jgi:hypothetical protein
VMWSPGFQKWAGFRAQKMTMAGSWPKSACPPGSQ